MATAAKTKTTATKTTAAPKRGNKPELKAAAKKAPAKRKDTLTALADATVKKNAAAKKTVSAPSKVSAETMMPEHVVKNLKGLRAAMDKYPNATGYSVDFKFGISIVNLLNTRGRTLAQVKLIPKK
jgi:hypothetical protein